MRSLQLSRGSQEGRQIKYRKAFLSDKSFSLCFFKWEVSLLDWIKMADLSAEQPQSTQLWWALLFPSSGSRCCWDQSTPVKASLWWKRTHIKTCMNASRWQMQRNSPAHSECCCLSGLCSVPAVTSSLCLCCRWCTSSLGCPSFCWRGTFLLFPLPGESERFTALCEILLYLTNKYDCFPIFKSLCRKRSQRIAKANQTLQGNAAYFCIPNKNQTQSQTLSGKWSTVWRLVNNRCVS